MNAVEATLQPFRNSELSVVDDSEKHLLAHIALAERQYAEGKCTPASVVAEELLGLAARA